MFRWQTSVGVGLGLVIGFLVLALAGSPQRNPIPSGPIISECEGHFRDLVIQYEPSAQAIAATVYRDFLRALESDVVVHALCPTQSAFDELRSVVGPVRCKLLPIIAGHPMTSWSRDRWVALQPATATGPTTVWSPLGESGGEVWPARAGDQRVGSDIAAALGPSVRARRGGINFDGGDFLTDEENVFVVPRVLQRNIQQTVNSREEFLDLLRRELKRPVILLEEAPDHHAGMFMASVGGRTMLVGDPSLAQKLASAPDAPAIRAFSDLPGGPDFAAETQRLFDAVARQCSAAGYRVVRIPVVPAKDGRTYLTYVNVLMDRQNGRRIVYLPWYGGGEPLNDAARTIWQSLGYEVRRVDCTAAYRHFGCIHCLVNVLARFPSSCKPPTMSYLNRGDEKNFILGRFRPDGYGDSSTRVGQSRVGPGHARLCGQKGSRTGPEAVSLAQGGSSRGSARG